MSIIRDGPTFATRPRKRSFRIAGHATSISLEDAFWDVLAKIAAERDCTLTALIAEIDAARDDTNLSSAVRVHVLNWALNQKNNA
ncbi:MAG: ribbon-helix-helix domain-containing protein [Pseudomonadota bacterium]